MRKIDKPKTIMGTRAIGGGKVAVIYKDGTMKIIRLPK